MVQNQEISSFCVVVLALLLFMINSAEPKPKNGPEIRRLIEMKTVDDKGVVRARVVAEYEQTNTEEQKSSSESAASTKRYQDDDEDSMGTSSGDSETYGESYDMIANDDPMGVPSANQSSSESSGSPSQSSSRSINSTSKPIDSKSSTVLPTTGQINASTPSSTTVREHVSTTTKMETTTSIPQTTSQATTTGTKVTVTTGTSANATTLSTLSSSTNNMQKNTTTFPPPVTEVETTAPATTTTSTPTTTATLKPTTQSNVNETTPFEVSTTGKSNNENTTVSPTKASVTSPGRVPDVKGQTDTEAKATRKTLFGFVTVEILIALLAGALFSVLLVAFLVYRLKKRNEGSYELSETIALRPKEIDEMGKKKEVFV